MIKENSSQTNLEKQLNFHLKEGPITTKDTQNFSVLDQSSLMEKGVGGMTEMREESDFEFIPKPQPELIEEPEVEFNELDGVNSKELEMKINGIQEAIQLQKNLVQKNLDEQIETILKGKDLVEIEQRIEADVYRRQ